MKIHDWRINRNPFLGPTLPATTAIAATPPKYKFCCSHPPRERSEFRFVRSPTLEPIHLYRCRRRRRQGKFIPETSDGGVPSRVRLHCYTVAGRGVHGFLCSRPSGGRAWSVYRPWASTVSPGDDEGPDAKRPPKLYILYYYNLTDTAYSFAINSLVNSEKSNRKVILMDFKRVSMFKLYYVSVYYIYYIYMCAWVRVCV